MDQRAGDAELLLHSARQVTRETVSERLEPGEGVEPLETLWSVGLRYPEKIRIEGQVFGHRQVLVEAEALWHVGHLGLGGLRVQVHPVLEDPDLPRSRGEHSCQHPQRSALARSVRTDESEELSRGDLEVETRDGVYAGELPT